MIHYPWVSRRSATQPRRVPNPSRSIWTSHILQSSLYTPAKLEVLARRRPALWRLIIPLAPVAVIHMVTAGVHRPTSHTAVVLRVHRHLIVTLSDGREAVLVVLRAGCGEEVDDELWHASEQHDRTRSRRHDLRSRYRKCRPVRSPTLVRQKCCGNLSAP